MPTFRHFAIFDAMKKISSCTSARRYADLMLFDENDLDILLGIPHGYTSLIIDAGETMDICFMVSHNPLFGTRRTLVSYYRFKTTGFLQLDGKCFIQRLHRAWPTVADGMICQTTTSEIRHADYRMLDYLEHPNKLSNERWAKLCVDLRDEMARFRRLALESIALCRLSGTGISVRAWRMIKTAIRNPYRAGMWFDRKIKHEDHARELLGERKLGEPL